MTRVDARALLKQRVVAVINISSGGCDATSADRIRTVMDAAGLSQAKIVVVTADEAAAALDQAIAQAEVLVLLGGDGTIMTAAGKCGPASVPMIPLPGGTVNMLPKALYGRIGWEQALADTLADPQVRAVSGGKVGRRPFYCVAILGAPALWADAREAMRHGDLTQAVTRSMTAIRRSGSEPLTYQFGDSLAGCAEAVAVICPLVSQVLTQDELSLEAVALDPETAAEAFRLAFHAMFDDWRHDPSVKRVKVKTVKVTGHGRLPVILDGETIRIGRTVSITFQPAAFDAIVPVDRT